MKLKTRSKLSPEALEDIKDILAFYNEGKPFPPHWKSTLFRVPPTPQEMKEMRKKVGFSQEAMARLFNTPKKTWQNWEQGLNEPGGAEAVIFQMIQRDPGTWKILIELARTNPKTGKLLEPVPPPIEK